MMGVAYMASWTPKPTRNAKSRYFVVSEEIMIPAPSPKKAMIPRRMGVRRKTMGQSVWRSAPWME